MKLTIEADALREVLANHMAARGTLAALEHIHLVADADSLSATTTDLAQEYTRRGPARVERAGEALPRADLLTGALHGLKGEVALEMERDRLVLRQARRRFAVACFGEAYPRMPRDVTQGAALRGDPVALAQAIGRVSYAAGRKDVRHYLNAVRVGYNAVVATNGHRLALAPVQVHGLGDREALIPIESVERVRAVLVAGAEIELTTNGALLIKTADAELLTRLVDGRFPDYARVTAPADKQTDAVEFFALDAQAAIKRLAAFATVNEPNKYKHLVMTLEWNGETIVLKARDGEDASEEVSGNGAAGACALGIDGRYLADVLAHADEALMVRWFPCDANSVQRFEFEGRDDCHYVMPMRV